MQRATGLGGSVDSGSSWRTAIECVQNSVLYGGKLGRTEELVHATKLSTRMDSEYKHKLILQIME